MHLLLKHALLQCDALFQLLQFSLVLFHLCLVDAAQLLQLSLQLVLLLVVFRLQRDHLIEKLILLQVEELFQHLGAVLVAQLQELLKLTLGDDDGALEVLVAQPDGLLELLLFYRDPVVGHLSVGSAFERLHLFEPFVVTPTPYGGTEQGLLTACLKDEIDQQLLRFQVHHVVITVISGEVQPVGTAVQSEGDRLQDR